MIRRYRKRYRKARSRKARPRMSRRYRRYRSATRPEVKMLQVASKCNSLKLHVGATASATLYPGQNISGGMFSYIVPGTGVDQRIGNNVFVKSVMLRGMSFGCPLDGTYNVGNYLIRIIAWTGLNTAASTITKFFASESENNFYLPLNRKKIEKVYVDKVFTVRSNGYTTANTTQDRTLGGVHYFNIKIPINRRITYIQGGNETKHETDVFNYAILVGTPGMCNASNDARQIACVSMNSTVYFTDV